MRLFYNIAIRGTKMTIEFFTYMLGMALMLYKAEIINHDQMLKLIEITKDNADKTLEDFMDELEGINKK